MCGINGILAVRQTNSNDVVRRAFKQSHELQHRGQESAGVAFTDGQKIKRIYGLGLVSDVRKAKKKQIDKGNGTIAIGHNRYSTKGGNILVNCQPFHASGKHSHAGVHNGTITNTAELKEELDRRGRKLKSTTDSEMIFALIASSRAPTIEEAVVETCRMLHGGYALLIMAKDKLIAARDPYGIRPLVLAKSDVGGRFYMVASETCAFHNKDDAYELIREVEPGEMLVIKPSGYYSRAMFDKEFPSARCIFELVYLMKPDSQIQVRLPDGRMIWSSIYHIRKKMGINLAKEHPVEKGIISPIPDAGIPPAIGLAQQLGLPYCPVFIRTRYSYTSNGRSFIEPDQSAREGAVHEKLVPIVDEINGQEVTLVDDSIVRGTTLPISRDMVRNAGATKVHVRSSFPPYRYTCYYGIDTAVQEELVAHNRTVEEIREYLNLDSLGYLSLEGLIDATGFPADHFCLACANGVYKEMIPDQNRSKDSLS